MNSLELVLNPPMERCFALSPKSNVIAFRMGAKRQSPCRGHDPRETNTRCQGPFQVIAWIGLQCRVLSGLAGRGTIETTCYPFPACILIGISAVF